jgi:rhodanese-related sulfurtransferase
MKRIKLYSLKIVIATIVVILFNNCLEDNISPPLNGDLNPTAELLMYLEAQGDFPNSNAAPALVDAKEVHSNSSNYLIADVRDFDDYSSGHIEGAVYVQNDTIYNYIKNLNTNLYTKIILVSTNGHRSAYYVCLLRLAGYSNIYSMNFGMAAWNMIFADEWLNSLKDDEARILFNNDYYPKRDLTSLPEIVFENPDAPIRERAEKRIESFIQTGFNRVKQYREGFILFGNDILVCYGKSRLYNSPNSAAVDPGRGHAAETIHYADLPFFELRTVQYLQTLPTDRKILIYGYNGQLSACIVAYLRVLGYDAISLEFGANQIFYNRMVNDVELTEFAFTTFLINDFPYVTGQ